MPSLDEFRATIAGKDLARQNRFEVRIKGPFAPPGDKQVDLLAESVTFPGQNIRSVPDDLRYGPAREHAQGVTYGDISMTFICTPGMQEKVYFEEWQKRIIDVGERNSGWNARFYKDYIGEIQIDQLDRQNQKNYEVTIVEAWPKTINAQEFTLSSNDSYQTVSVDFAYRYWFRSALSLAVHRPPKLSAAMEMHLPSAAAAYYERPGAPPPYFSAENAAVRISAEKAAQARAAAARAVGNAEIRAKLGTEKSSGGGLGGGGVGGW
jgi:hypothetical protein